MKKLIVMAIVAAAFVTSCNTNNAKATEEAPKEMEAVKEVPVETPADEAAQLKAEMKEDSLRQVKEHGHAH